jgi:hypothetical protein
MTEDLARDVLSKIFRENAKAVFYPAYAEKY